ncbi:hypothetical protein E2C01_055210 [Portunus trituberculatus]|uniref:Uncharacterized protein n=1 Tax=Portunus trituberculatus TaxID=210409 RepID=A0A5B7GU80_PORTR|nr:hypothetical protein [Portunus trituberculatus]
MKSSSDNAESSSKLEADASSTHSIWPSKASTRRCRGDLSRPLLVVISIASSIVNFPELVERERACETSPPRCGSSDDMKSVLAFKFR